MAKIFEIAEARAKREKLAELKQMFGELFQRVVIPFIDIPEVELNYILPTSFTRHIDDLSISEMDELLNGHLKFFILK